MRKLWIFLFIFLVHFWCSVLNIIHLDKKFEENNSAELYILDLFLKITIFVMGLR